MDKETDGAPVDESPDYTGIPKPKFSGYQIDTRAIKVKDVSLQIMAAIELRIPDSGIDWLDKMIAKAERRDIAVKLLQGDLANSNNGFTSFERAAEIAYEEADAMIAERAKGE